MLYQIHRYPADLIDVVHLSRGERVVIRPVLPQDEAITRDFFAGLSGPSRYDRFMGAMRQLPPGLIERFTHVDHANHVALVAEVFVGGVETVVGEARYVRSADGAEAEFAVSVAEEWQGRGLASLMLRKLICRARQMGVQRLAGETLATNERMLHLARKAGFIIRDMPGWPGAKRLELELVPALGTSPCDAGSSIGIDQRKKSVSLSAAAL